jgi:uncharacterized membrane protein (DUF106 family)
MVLESVFNFLFGWTINFNQTFAIFFVTAVFTLLSTLVYKFTTKQDMIKKLKEETKQMNKEIRSSVNNPKKVKEIEKKLWENNITLFKQNLIPMIITLVPFLLLFGWLKTAFEVYTEPLFGYFGWFGTYIIMTLILSLVFRKILKVH